MADAKPVPVVILGMGSTDLSVAALFADAGQDVVLIDPQDRRRDRAAAGIARPQEAMALAGVRKGGCGLMREVAAATEVPLAETGWVIDCGPQSLSSKPAIFGGLLRDGRADAVLGAVISPIPMSHIIPDAQDHRRCLVVHPVTPPAISRVIELCPASGTTIATRRRAQTLFEQVGFAAVLLTHEIEGLRLHRLQGAASYRLEEERCDRRGIKAVMRLGPRRALSGLFEAAKLNAPGGTRVHARIGAKRGKTVARHDPFITRVETQRRADIVARKVPQRAYGRASAVRPRVKAGDILRGERP